MKNNIRRDVIVWNNRFPLDRWWRKKFSVPYLSKKHRESSFFCQYYEYYEEKIFEEYYKKEGEDNGEGIPAKYIPLSGNWWKGLIVTKKEIDDWFNTTI